jgi:hypothetical protein
MSVRGRHIDIARGYFHRKKCSFVRRSVRGTLRAGGLKGAGAQRARRLLLPMNVDADWMRE